MNKIDWFKHPQYLEPESIELEEAEGAYALNEAWKKVYGEYPHFKSLALLWAQAVLETGRFKKMHNYNFGHIKKRHANPQYNISDDGHYYTMFRCGEIINARTLYFNPPHLQCHFRAYKTVVAGAEDYLTFVSKRKRYEKAWKEVLKGDPFAYSHELKVAGYYTANEATYTQGIVKLTNEFIRKKDELLSWEPEQDTIPSPPIEESDTIPSSSVEIEVIIPPPPPIPVEISKEKIPNFKPNKNKQIKAVIILAVVGAAGWIWTAIQNIF